MRILIDQNISHRIIAKLDGTFRELHHVRDFALTDSSDFSIFDYAKSYNFDAILTLDEDFHHIVLQRDPLLKLFGYE